MGITVGSTVSLGAGRFLRSLAFEDDIRELGAAFRVSRRLMHILVFPEYRH